MSSLNPLGCTGLYGKGTKTKRVTVPIQFVEQVKEICLEWLEAERTRQSVLDRQRKKSVRCMERNAHPSEVSENGK